MAKADTQAPGVVQAGEVQVRRALLSVSDKRGLVDFARGLASLGVEIVSTGGTAGDLAAGGVEGRSVEGYTRLPEDLDGRVKNVDRESGVEGKRVDLGGRRVIKKKKQ